MRHKTVGLKPSMVVHTFNPSTWDMEAEAGRFVLKKKKRGGTRPEPGKGVQV